MDLLQETCAYLAEAQAQEAAAYGVAGRAVVAQETTRLIARLTQIMWLGCWCARPSTPAK